MKSIVDINLLTMAIVYVRSRPNNYYFNGFQGPCFDNGHTENMIFPISAYLYFPKIFIYLKLCICFSRDYCPDLGRGGGWGTRAHDQL